MEQCVASTYSEDGGKLLLENVTKFLPHYEQTVLFMVSAMKNSYFIFAPFTFVVANDKLLLKFFLL